MNTRIIDTGLRAMDLFSPIPLGGDFLLAGEPKAGARVLGEELVCRLARRPGNPPRTTVFLDAALPDGTAFEEELRTAVAGGAEIIAGSSVSEEGLRSRLDHRPLSLGNAVFAFSNEGAYLESFRRAATAGRNGSAGTPLTSFVVTENPPRDRFDARALAIRALAAEAVYPALDVRSCESSAIGLDLLAPNFTRVARMAREAMARILGDLEPGRVRDESWSWQTDLSKRPALQALLFLSQPFYCAEPYTGMSATVVPVRETVEQYRAILEGRHAAVPALRFRFLNGLDELNRGD